MLTRFKKSCRLAATFIVAGLGILNWADPGNSLEMFGTDSLVIKSGTQTHSIKIELAVTEAQRGQGLMYRQRLDADAGMLFLYERQRVITMWMKNTLIPLDMLFIDGVGKVVHVHERAIPLSLRAISSRQRARAVLELPGGTIARLGLKVGDRIIHEAFGTR